MSQFCLHSRWTHIINFHNIVDTPHLSNFIPVGYTLHSLINSHNNCSIIMNSDNYYFSIITNTVLILRKKYWAYIYVYLLLWQDERYLKHLIEKDMDSILLILIWVHICCKVRSNSLVLIKFTVMPLLKFLGSKHKSIWAETNDCDFHFEPIKIQIKCHNSSYSNRKT